ncbi:MAG: AI-2E family transporter [Verrucomicrobiales bacterium]
MDQVDDVTKKIEAGGRQDGTDREVAVKDPEDSPIVGMKDTVWFLGVVGVLSFLFLCHGRSIAVCLGKLTGMGDKIHVIGSDVSRYLSTITLINACLGAAIALAMWLTGMPNPLLWGVVGALLNFVPVLGALAGTLLILIVATLSFDTPGAIALPTLSYFALTATEGNVLTPMILGKRFNINPVIVFLWLCLWAWVWGVAGALLAVPLLVAVQHFASSLQPLNWFSELCGSCSDESVEGGESGASDPGAAPDPDTAPTAPG